MNYPIAIAGGLTLLALFAHTFVGIRESLSIAPAKLTEKGNVANFEVLERNWVQIMCAFQMITIDLLALSTLLFLLAFTDIIGQKQLLAFSLAVFYFLWGSAWLLQLVIFKRQAKDFLFLGHWLYWFVIASFIFWGAQSL